MASSSSNQTVTRTADHLSYAGDDGKKFLPSWQAFYVRRNKIVKLADIDQVEKFYVSGSIHTSELTVNVPMYEVVFVLNYAIMCTDDDDKWDGRMKFKVILPDGMEPLQQERTVNLTSKPDKRWLEILAGEFKTTQNVEGIIKFSLDNQSLNTSYYIKSVIVRPVSIPSALSPVQYKDMNVRELSIHRGQQRDHWKFVMLPGRSKSYGNHCFEVAFLEDIVWLEVNGKFDASRLIIDQTYEVVFLLGLTLEAEGWENNEVTLRVNQESREQIIEEDYKKDYRYEEYNYDDYLFEELKAGEITMDQATRTDGILFSLLETKSGHSKKGLVIKSVFLRPV